MLRFDTFSITRKPYRTPEGYLIVPGRVAKAGVLEYRNADGSARRELVLPSELARADSLESIALKPVTDGHPREGRVDASNARDVQRGFSLQRVRSANPYVEIEILITDEELAEKVERDDARDLSLGYTLERLDEAPGVHPEFGEYDAIQRGRIANHIAVVPRGRAGSDVGVRVDSGEDVRFYREDWIAIEDAPLRVRQLNDDDRERWMIAYGRAYWPENEDKIVSPSEREERAIRAADLHVFGKTYEDTMPQTEKQTTAKSDANLTDFDTTKLDSAIETLAASARDVAVRVAEMRGDAVEPDGERADEDAPGHNDEGLQAVVDALGGFVTQLDGLREHADALNKEYEEKRAQLDALYGELMNSTTNEDAMKEKNDAAPEDRADTAPSLTEDDMLAWHRERKALEAAATGYRVDNADELSNDDFRRAIVSEHFGKERVDGATDAEIMGYFKALQVIREKRADSYSQASRAVPPATAAASKEDAAQAAYVARLKNGGRQDSADAERSALQKLAEMLKQ